MKQSFNILLISLLFIINSSFANYSDKIKTVNFEALQKMQKNGEIVLIDVREEEEFKQGHLEGATLIPLSKINTNEVEKNNPQKKVVFLYCRSGKRSLKAAEKLLKENPNLQIYNLEGGILSVNQKHLKK